MITRSEPTRYDLEAAGRVSVVGVDIPFRDLVYLLIKIAFASIPAAIIVGIVYAVTIGIVGVAFAAIFGARYR